MSDSSKRAVARHVADLLAEWFRDATTTLLDHRNPFELLIATILAARCTDEKVNQIAPRLFERYPGPADLASADLADLEQIIRPTGFYRNKARAIRACCAALVERFGGEVPKTMDELVTLPGVGRKTANVVLTNCFGVPGVVVDTHVHRLARRLGLSDGSTADDVERDLMDLLPREEWSDFSHRLTYFGRKICLARRPKCGECRVKDRCPSAQV